MSSDDTERRSGDRTDDETEFMSQLLLKGATMLAEHCDECGNPRFRYKGEEFCPVCNRRTAQEKKKEAETRMAKNIRQRGEDGEDKEKSDEVRDSGTGQDQEKSDKRQKPTRKRTGDERIDKKHPSPESEDEEGQNQSRNTSRSTSHRPEKVEKTERDRDLPKPAKGRGGTTANREVVTSLTRLAQRLAAEAEEERDISRVNERLDTLERTLDLIERLS